MVGRFIKMLGESFSLLYFVLVVLIFSDVAVRTITNKSQVWIGELEWQLFAMLFLIGMSYALQEDKHVRVDLFFNKFSVKKQLWTDLPSLCKMLLWVKTIRMWVEVWVWRNDQHAILK